MPLVKAKGNMYSWCSHTHSHLGGACLHGCSYCYVQAMAKRFPNMKARYSGPVRLIKEELDTNYGKGKTIFIEHMNDLFAIGVRHQARVRILNHARSYPLSRYVFQTKDPHNAIGYLHAFRADWMIGTTIETDRWLPDIMGEAPTPIHRAKGMESWRISAPRVKRFITIEPVLDFNPDDLVALILRASPAFVNIGADSKGYHLPEPPWGKVENLIGALQMAGIEIRQKSNLERLKK